MCTPPLCFSVLYIICTICSLMTSTNANNSRLALVWSAHCVQCRAGCSIIIALRSSGKCSFPPIAFPPSPPPFFFFGCFFCLLFSVFGNSPQTTSLTPTTQAVPGLLGQCDDVTSLSNKMVGSMHVILTCIPGTTALMKIMGKKIYKSRLHVSGTTVCA